MYLLLACVCSLLAVIGCDEMVGVSGDERQARRAVAYFTIASDGVKGTFDFESIDNGKSVRVNGTVYNLKPNTKHGLHIHENMSLKKSCSEAGPHFNPYNKDHGDRENYMERHVGDLGNVQADQNGRVSVNFTDDAISLDCDIHNDNCVLNRALVLHEKEDDLGKGLDEDSLKTGNAGGRLACGLITPIV